MKKILVSTVLAVTLLVGTVPAFAETTTSTNTTQVTAPTPDSTIHICSVGGGDGEF